MDVDVFSNLYQPFTSAYNWGCTGYKAGRISGLCVYIRPDIFSNLYQPLTSAAPTIGDAPDIKLVGYPAFAYRICGRIYSTIYTNLLPAPIILDGQNIKLAGYQAFEWIPDIR